MSEFIEIRASEIIGIQPTSGAQRQALVEAGARDTAEEAHEVFIKEASNDQA